MNVFTASNNKAMASIPRKRKENFAPPIQVEDFKPHEQGWLIPSVKLSPIVSAPPNKVVQAKRRKRRTWSQAEDNVLIEQVRKVLEPSHLRWTAVGAKINSTFGSSRTGKQCRERWLNHLRPDLKKGNWTADEEMMIDQLYTTFGPKWSTMSKLIKNRTDNDIKNKWYSMKRKEELARKSKKPTTKSPSKRARTAKEQNVDQRRSMEDTADPELMKNAGTRMFSGSNYTSELAILPTVTDGGSAENSPVPQTKYLSFEV